MTGLCWYYKESLFFLVYISLWIMWACYHAQPRSTGVCGQAALWPQRNVENQYLTKQIISSNYKTVLWKTLLQQLLFVSFFSSTCKNYSRSRRSEMWYSWGYFCLNVEIMFMEEERICCLRKEKHSGFSFICGLQSAVVVALTSYSFGWSCCSYVRRLKYALCNSGNETLTLGTQIMLAQST